LANSQGLLPITFMDDLRQYRQAVLLGVCVMALGACASSSAGEQGGAAGTGGGETGGAGDGGAPGTGGAKASGGESGGGGVATGGATASGGTEGEPDAGAAGEGGAGEDASAPDGGPPATPPMGPSPACAGGAMVPGPDGYQTVMVNGKTRKFLVRVPAGYDGKTPRMLFLGMHGAGANGASFEGRISAIRSAMGPHIIYAYPDALATAAGTITWARDYIDDLAFMDAMLAWMKQKVCYDTARVVAFGQSSGAYISHAMGCHRGSVLRAIASNGGGGRINEFLDCLGQPVAAWVSNGLMDPSHLVDAKRARDGWLKMNGCTVDNPVNVDPPPCVSYTGCKPGFPLHYCENSGGHDIPSYAPAGVSAFFLGNFDK
jgi:poly(3-hydroxybutyrate) depolymerase